MGSDYLIPATTGFLHLLLKHMVLATDERKQDSVDLPMFLSEPNARVLEGVGVYQTRAWWCLLGCPELEEGGTLPIPWCSSATQVRACPGNLSVFGWDAPFFGGTQSLAQW